MNRTDRSPIAHDDHLDSTVTIKALNSRPAALHAPDIELIEQMDYQKMIKIGVHTRMSILITVTTIHTGVDASPPTSDNLADPTETEHPQ